MTAEATQAPGADAAARDYWTRMMDEAYAFMQRIREYPIKESEEPVTFLPEAAQKASVAITFVSRPHVEGLPRLFYLRESLVAPLLKAAHDMNRRGWVMVIEDAYRSRHMQRGLPRAPYVLETIADQVIWETQKADVSPTLLLKRIAALCANWPRTGTHMSASAVDISVIDMATGNEVDRGAPYLTLTHVTPMLSPFNSPSARTNRSTITEIMASNGFVAYPYEFWHYSANDTYDHYLRHTGEPAAFGPVRIDTSTGMVKPLEDIETELNPLPEIEELAVDALTKALASKGSQSRARRHSLLGPRADIEILAEDEPVLSRLIALYTHGLAQLEQLPLIEPTGTFRPVAIAAAKTQS